jgi:hypothetical protein
MLKAVLFCAVDADWWVPYIFFELSTPYLEAIHLTNSRDSVWLRGVDLQDLLRVCHWKRSESPTIRRAAHAAPRPLDLYVRAEVQNHVILTRRSLQQVGVMLCKFQDTTAQRQHSDSATAQLAVVLIRRRRAPKWGTWLRWASFSTSKSFRWSWCFGEKDGKFSQWLCCISMHEFNRF